MIQTSEAFHQAILDGKPQRVLITFPTCFFTNDDISVSGLKYSEMVNPDEDLTVGSATSSEISFSVLNDNGLLNNFGFGQFDADIGVLIDSQPYSQYGNVTAQYGTDVFTGHNDVPYLRLNGDAVNAQPDFPVKSILIVDNTIYCLGENKKVFSIKKSGKWQVARSDSWKTILDGTWEDLLSSLSGQYVETSEFMYEKFSKYVVKRVGITRNDQIEIEYTSDGVKQTYEYARLGRFIAQRPSRVKTRVVGIEGNDFMTKFDTMLDGISLSFPMTISSLLEKICSYCGVALKTSSFINSGRIIKEYPQELYDATGREAIKWIAELACGFARVDREGRLEIVWFSDTNLSINESNYSSFVPSEYIVKPIDKVQIKSTADDVGAIIGDGVNTYVIQSNPLAIIESEADGIALTQPIYDRLSSFPTITPCAANWFGDWSYQAGDVVTVSQWKDSYYLPIYTLSLSWNGAPKVVIESTGNESREPISVSARESYVSKRNVFELKKTVEGFSLRISDAEGNAAEALATAQGYETRIADAEGNAAEALATAQGYETRIADAEGNVSNLQTSATDTVNIFKSIGAVTGGETVITQNKGGTTWQHTNIGGKTQASADGFKMIDANGNVIGGLISINGQLYASVQALMNPSYPNFRIGIADRDFEGEQFGLHWTYAGVEQGSISAFDGGMRQDSFGSYGLYSNGDTDVAGRKKVSVFNSTNGAGIYFDENGYGYIKFLRNGTTIEQMSFDAIYDVVFSGGD